MPTPLFLSRNPNPSPSSTNPHLSSDPRSAAMSTSGVYVPPMRRLRSVIASTNGSLAPPPPAAAQVQQTAPTPEWRMDERSPSPPSPSQPRRRDIPPLPRPPRPEHFRQQSAGYARYAAYDDFSEDDSDREMDRTSVSSKGASTLDNVDEWKWKLHMLLRNDDEQEIVSRERKDRRDFEQLAQLADRMGLHSRQYSKVVVFSKVPLPNYRSDLDDKRPQREVSIPAGLQREVDALLEDYLARKRTNSGNFPSAAFSRSSSTDSFATDEGFFDQQDNQTSTNAVMERIQRRKSLQLRNQQAAWQVVVVSGETGCGKTTQLPQYILESEIDAARGATCSIICTQPRRISAIAVSERVAAERGEKIGESVGYKVRLEGMRGRDTRLLFCTTGVLLRRLLVDRNLKGVTHVIVDEIHERGMNEDFLLIVLKDLLPRRPELRLILMSATLNAELFSSYFGGAPMIHIPGFTYPVRNHFLEDILEFTGHRLTPYNQIDDYGQEKSWKMQKQAISKRKSQIASVVEDAVEAADLRNYSPRTRDSLSCWNPDSIGFNLIENVLCHICQKERPGAVLVFMTGWDDINALKEQLHANPLLGDPTKVLLLACHGSMASSEQKLIFDKPEPGVRKIVLATNLAETSITINDVVFVVDCGKAKETSYDALNNTPCLLPTWISKASARQVQNAIDYLKVIGAFDLNEELTVLGKHLSMLPVEPKLGKMLIFGAIFNCLDPILTIVSGLSVRDPFLTPFDKKDVSICLHDAPILICLSNKEKSISLKTMEDGQVMLYSSSVNGKEAKIPFPWLVFNEKVKVNSVFLRDSTAISDSILLLFGGNIKQGGLDGHLKMLGGYLEFFMNRDLASTYLSLKNELEDLIHCKLQNPRMDIQTSEELLSAIRLLVTEDPCSGRFVYGRQELRSKKAKTMLSSSMNSGGGNGGDNAKNQLQTLLTRAGHDNPSYKTKQIKSSLFRSTVEFNGMQFVGQPCANKKLAEKDAAAEALNWLTGDSGGATTDSRDTRNADLISVLTKPPRRSRHSHRRRS
nr:unnamed protein product [Digitaria exilis]